MSTPAPLTGDDFEELSENSLLPVRTLTAAPTPAPRIHRPWFIDPSISNYALGNGSLEGLPRLMDEFAYLEPLRQFYEQVQREPDDATAHLRHPEVPKHCHECRRYYSYRGTLPIKIEITVEIAWLAERIFREGENAYLCTECFFKIGGRVDANSTPVIQDCQWFRPICLYRFTPPCGEAQNALHQNPTNESLIN